MCGADLPMMVAISLYAGSPPRVRSRFGLVEREFPVVGITSACAEQTTPWVRMRRTGTDHLRVCGADRPRTADHRLGRGSPPRVRSRLRHLEELGGKRGITSACAEQT